MVFELKVNYAIRPLKRNIVEVYVMSSGDSISKATVHLIRKTFAIWGIIIKVNISASTAAASTSYSCCGILTGAVTSQKS